MAYTEEFSLALGSGQTGLSLQAQLIDSTGALTGTPITTGFTEIGAGNYLWSATIPDGFNGGVVFTAVGTTSPVMAFADINSPPVGAPPTPRTPGATSYALPADLLARYDARTLGDLVNDQGARQTPAQLLTNPVLQAALDDAAGMINSATLFGRRYSVAELQGLTGVDLSLLLRLNCDLSFGYLVSRRGVSVSDIQKGQVDAAHKLLEQIKEGDRLFNVAADVAEGVPGSQFPSMTTYNHLQLVREHASRSFPVRRQQQQVSD